MVNHIKANLCRVTTGATIGATSHSLWLMQCSKPVLRTSSSLQGGTGKRKQLLMNNTPC